MPSGTVNVVMETGSLIRIVYSFVVVSGPLFTAGTLSVNLNVTGYDPAVVGVPEISPVALLRDSPDGRLPLATLQI